MRMLGGLIWIAIPVLAFMLFLPHETVIDYEMTLLFLFCVLLVNFLTMLLPFKEKLLSQWFSPIMALYGVSLIVLVCAAIRYSGGVRSPLFT